MSASAARIEANRQNAQASVGPRTEEGKARSALNAVKHGLAAQKEYLPGEDPEAVAARRAELIAALQPVGRLELELVHRIQASLAGMERCDRCIEALLQQKHRKREREFRLAETHATQGYLDLLETQPLIAVVGLRQTRPGCAQLIDRWKLLARRLDEVGRWDVDEFFRALRLFGLRPEDLLETDGARELLRLAVVAARGAGAPDWAASLAEFCPQGPARIELVRLISALGKGPHAPTPEAALRRLKEFVQKQIQKTQEHLDSLEAAARADQNSNLALGLTDDPPKLNVVTRYYNAHQRSLRGALRDLELAQKLRKTAAAEAAPTPPVTRPDKPVTQDQKTCCATETGGGRGGKAPAPNEPMPTRATPLGPPGLRSLDGLDLPQNVNMIDFFVSKPS